MFVTTKHFVHEQLLKRINALIEGCNSAPNQETKDLIINGLKQTVVCALGHLYKQSVGNVGYSYSKINFENTWIEYSVGANEYDAGRYTYVVAHAWMLNKETGEITFA